MRSPITLLPTLILLSVALGPQARALDGLEWTWHNPVPQGNHLTTLVESGDFVLAAGLQGTVLRSEDGRNWDPVDAGTQRPIYGGAFGGGTTKLVGPGIVLSSDDGTGWTTVVDEEVRFGRNAGTGGRINAVVFGQDVFVAVGDDGYLAVSANGIDWENLPVPWDPMSGSEAGDIRDIAYGGGRFVAVASHGPFGTEQTNSNHLIYASDPFSWKFSWVPHPPMDGTMFVSQASLARVTYGPNGFMATGVSETAGEYEMPLMLHSEEGAVWNYVETDSKFIPGTVTVSPHGYLATGYELAPGAPAVAYSSLDGLVWEEIAAYGGPAPEFLREVYHHRNRMVVVGVGEYGAVVSYESSLPYIERHPRAEQVFEGETLELAVDVWDPQDGELEFQWRIDGEPIADDDIDGYAALVQTLDIPIATGENLYTPADFARFLRREAVDIIHPDLRRTGGPTAMLQIGTMADAFRRSYASHGGGPVQLNVMACLPNAIYLETDLLGSDSPFELRDGTVPIPQGPGFAWS